MMKVWINFKLKISPKKTSCQRLTNDRKISPTSNDQVTVFPKYLKKNFELDTEKSCLKEEYQLKNNENFEKLNYCIIRLSSRYLNLRVRNPAEIFSHSTMTQHRHTFSDLEIYQSTCEKFRNFHNVFAC